MPDFACNDDETFRLEIVGLRDFAAFVAIIRGEINQEAIDKLVNDIAIINRNSATLAQDVQDNKET